LRVPLILVIDDEPNVRQLLAGILERENYEVIQAEDGGVGLRLFHDHRPSVVVTDIFMPEKEGLETIREIRHACPRTRIVAVSGGGRHGIDMLDMALGLGASTVLKKPFRRNNLLEAVKG
jgi:DNA-binding response OmpR family regulator